MSDTAFKNWFNDATIERLSARLRGVHPDFDAQRFRAAVGDLTPLELKARVVRITEALPAGLGLPFPQAAAVLTASLGPPVDPSVPNQFQMEVWPLVHYVGRYGLDFFEESMAAFHALTQRMSAEFDIRGFLVREPERTLARLAQWSADPSEHVRRLVSEGTRPRLPWGTRLPAFIADPRPVVALLERLKDDPSPYVRRSVANNLNDIAKDHPALVVEIGGRWLQENPARGQMIRHALRTLIKAGDPGALGLLGHDADAALVVEGLSVPTSATIGGALPFQFTLVNPTDAPVSAVVDYRIHHAGARTVRSPKVFKLRAVMVPARSRLNLEKRHSLRVVTTRRLYPGLHKLEVQVNGNVLAEAEFMLAEPT